MTAELNEVTKIYSNGSRWLGEEPATIDDLLAVLAAEPLRRSFEIYGNFITNDGEGVTHFWGNFETVSHVFSIATRDPELVTRLTQAIRSNQQTQAYLSQPIPKEIREIEATTPELCGVCNTDLADMGAHGWGCPRCADIEMDALDIPKFDLSAKAEHKLQDVRRPALKRTGPASTRRNDASIPLTARVHGPAKRPEACEAKVAEILVTELPAATRIRISLAIPSPGTGSRFFWIDLSEDDSKRLRAALLAAETAGAARSERE